MLAMDKNLSYLPANDPASPSADVQNTRQNPMMPSLDRTTAAWDFKRKIVVSVCAFGTVAIGGLLWPFVAPGLRKIALPYVPATDAQVAVVRSVLAGRQGTMLDLGSGDGRLVIAAAQVGLQSTGVELNIWLVLWSRFASFRSGLLGRARFYRKNIYKTHFGDYDNIVFFGVPGMMPSIKEKLLQEMRLDAVFVACRFPLPDCTPACVLGEGHDTVWIYRKIDVEGASW